MSLNTLNKITIGHLTVNCQGIDHSFGNKESTMRASLVVKDPMFWLRLIAFSALGLGEAYMYGDISIDDLPMFLNILTLNRECLNDGKRLLPAGLNSLINNVFTTRITNSLLNSRNNIAAHYDLGNEMFAAFLDPTMMYSCPIWNSDSETLEQAQMNKIHALFEMSAVRNGDFVLEIEQQVLAQERIEKAGYSRNITVLLQDYRTLDPKKYQFDRIISCEMLEAVGPEYLSVYFETCEKLMKPHATLTVQCITMPECRYKAYCQKTDYIQKHIFPGGHCPSFTAIVEAINQGTNGKLMVEHVQNIGPHYAKALRLWREEFLANYDQVAKEHGKENIYDEIFKRRFEYYFAYCEVGFATRTLGDMQFVVTRVNNIDLIRDIPL